MGDSTVLTFLHVKISLTIHMLPVLSSFLYATIPGELFHNIYYNIFIRRYSLATNSCDMILENNKAECYTSGHPFGVKITETLTYTLLSWA